VVFEQSERLVLTRLLVRVTHAGGKGLGKGGAKRHRKVLRDNIQVNRVLIVGVRSVTCVCGLLNCTIACAACIKSLS
jgi:hypothetical protein